MTIPTKQLHEYKPNSEGSKSPLLFSNDIYVIQDWTYALSDNVWRGEKVQKKT